jgi:hypothetical protein
MVFSLVVIGIVAVVAYVWSARGFFSAFLHMAATVCAGAIAFGLWEPVTYLILNQLKGTEIVTDNAWAIGLGGTFAVALAALTLAQVALVRANAHIDSVPNLIGGAACGAVSGTIAAGVMAISLSYVRANSDFLGFQPHAYDRGSGAIVRQSELMFPVDRLVAGLYGRLSETTLRTGTPLAAWQPIAADQGHLVRTGPQQTTLKVVAFPGDVQIAGRYTVGEQTDVPLKDLLTDTFDERVQKAKLLDGSDAPAGVKHQIEGYVLALGPGLREKGGQIVFGTGHVTLLARNAEDTKTEAFFPFALVSQAQGDSRQLGRWRYDGSDVYIASVGGASDQPMAFEFLMPKGYVPQALVVKNLRLSLIDPTTETTIAARERFAAVSDRDDSIRSRDLFTSIMSEPTLTKDGATTIQTGGNTFESAIRPTNRLRVQLNKATAGSRGLSLGEKNRIQDGEAQFRPNELLQRGTDKALLVETLEVDNTTGIMQVDVGSKSPMSLLSSETESASGAPTLVDELGQRYQAIGFVYKDSASVQVRYTPGRPIAGIADLPSLSRSRTDQELTLIFKISLGVKIKSYAVGTSVIAELSPPISIDAPQNR